MPNPNPNMLTISHQIKPYMHCFSISVNRVFQGGFSNMTGNIKIENDNLIFELHGIDKILSIKRSITVPLKHVVSVSTEHVTLDPKLQMKLVGVRLPTVIKDGRFLTSEGMMFFEMHDPDKCITVTLNHEHYKKIVFEVDNKEAAAKQINDAIKSRKK